MTVSLRDAADEIIVEAVEQPPEPAAIWGFGPSSELTTAAYLRLSKEDQDTLVTGQWVHCYFALN